MQASILLTGFGPFPGVPDNPSARLAERLAGSLATRHRITHAVLPTEWHAVREAGLGVLRDTAPDIVMHLGVCRAAATIRIERSAANATAPTPDAIMALPAAGEIVNGGPARLHTSAPVARLARTLRVRGIPALPSLSAGRYICNYLYYLSLDWAARQPVPPLTLFVHIPPLGHGLGVMNDTQQFSGTQSLLSLLIEEFERLPGRGLAVTAA